MKQRYCDVDFVVTLKVPVEARTRPGAREEAEATVEYWLTEEAGRGGLNAVFGRFGVGDTGYSLRPDACYTEDVPDSSDELFPEWDAAAELADDARRGK